MTEEKFKEMLDSRDSKKIIYALNKLINPTKFEKIKNFLRKQINKEIIERNYSLILQSVQVKDLVIILKKLSELDNYRDLQNKYFEKYIQSTQLDIGSLIGEIYLPVPTIKRIIGPLYRKTHIKYELIKKLIKNTKDKLELKQLIDIIYEECICDIFDAEEELLSNFLMYIRTTSNEYKDIKEYLISKLNENLNKLNPIAIVNLMQSNIVDKQVLNQIIDKNREEVLFNIIKYKTLNYEQIILNDEDVYMLKIIFEEVLKNENKRVSEIKLNEGAFSKVFIIGDKVIKIGIRNTFVIKNNKRFLKPLLRKMFAINGSDICVEITERVIVDETITEEELYEVYKELRDKGIYWGDCHKGNVGRLIKDNKIYFNEPIYFSDENCGYIKTDESNIVLKSGEIVIIDNDYTYEESIPTSYLLSTNQSYTFEKRYKKENKL